MTHEQVRTTVSARVDGHDLACGREAAARDAMAEAEAIAREFGAEPDSAMACDIAALRELLVPAAAP